MGVVGIHHGSFRFEKAPGTRTEWAMKRRQPDECPRRWGGRQAFAVLHRGFISRSPQVHNSHPSPMRDRSTSSRERRISYRPGDRSASHRRATYPVVHRLNSRPRDLQTGSRRSQHLHRPVPAKGERVEALPCNCRLRRGTRCPHCQKRKHTTSGAFLWTSHFLVNHCEGTMDGLRRLQCVQPRVA